MSQKQCPECGSYNYEVQFHEYRYPKLFDRLSVVRGERTTSPKQALIGNWFVRIVLLIEIFSLVAVIYEGGIVTIRGNPTLVSGNPLFLILLVGSIALFILTFSLEEKIKQGKRIEYNICQQCYCNWKSISNEPEAEIVAHGSKFKTPEEVKNQSTRDIGCAFLQLLVGIITMVITVTWWVKRKL